MANLVHVSHMTKKFTLMIFFTIALLLHISSSSTAAARLLIEPPSSVNLALAGNDVVDGRFLPCNTANMSTSRRTGNNMGFQALRLCAKPGQFLLSMLPKGVVPPSGPSRRTNDNNN